MPGPISVTIPVYGQSHLTRRCLDSLLKNSRAVGEVIVVNNASKDDTAEVLKSYSGKFRAIGIEFSVLTNSENQGFGRACNQGIFAARGEWIAVLNNDTWLMPNWDQALLESAERHGADMVGPYYDERPFDEGRLENFARTFTRRNHRRKIREWVSILMFFRRDSIRKLRGFDPEYFVTSEDNDLRHRMDLEGMRYYQVGNCVIWHHSKGTRDSGALPSDYEQQGLAIFQRKWGFDHRVRDAHWLTRLRRKWRRFRNARGYL